MKHRSLFAATLGCVLISSSAFAGFTLSALPSAQPATVASLRAYDIFAQGDADPSDGVNLQGVSFTFTGLNGTKAFFSSFDNGDGTFGTDQYNFGPGTSPSNQLDRDFSNLRIGTRTAGQHGFTQYPGDADSPLTSDEAANGLSTFNADYAVLSAASSIASTTAPGARFARLVIRDSGSFRIDGYFGGEVGSKSAATLSVIVCRCSPERRPPSVVPGTTASVVFGQIVTKGAPFSVVVNVTDPDATDVLSLAVGTVAGISNVVVTGGGTSPEAFTITGTVDYSLNGSTVVVPVTASDGFLTGTGSFSLVVTPEPTALGALALCGLLRRRCA